MSLQEMFKFHLDERFNLKEDIKLVLTNPAVYIPIVITILLEIAVLQGQLFGQFGGFGLSTIWFFVERILLPVSFLYVIRRILLEFKPAKPIHVWKGMGHCIMPAIYFTLFVYITQRIIVQISFMFIKSSWSILIVYALINLLLDILVVVLAMGEGEDLRFLSDGLNFFTRKFAPIMLVGLVRYGILNLNSNVLALLNITGFIVINTISNYLALFAIVLIYLRSSRQIVMKRGLYRYTQ